MDDPLANAAQQQGQRSVADNITDLPAIDVVQAMGEVVSSGVMDGAVDVVGDAIATVAGAILDL